jgi:hypothetical protein
MTLARHFDPRGWILPPGSLGSFLATSFVFSYFIGSIVHFLFHSSPCLLPSRGPHRSGRYGLGDTGVAPL